MIQLCNRSADDDDPLLLVGKRAKARTMLVQAKFFYKRSNTLTNSRWKALGA